MVVLPERLRQKIKKMQIGGDDYDRLWPIRGGTLFQTSTGYLTSVILTALAGACFGLIVLLGSCIFCCSRKSRCKDRCCPKLFYTPRRHRVFVICEVSLIVLAGVGVIISLIGSLDLSTTLEPLFGALRYIEGIAVAALVVVRDIAFFSAQVLELLSEANITSSLNVPNGTDFLILSEWAGDTVNAVCTASDAIAYSVLGLICVIVAGHGLAFAGAALFIIGFLRSERSMVSLGAGVVAFSMFFIGLMFAISSTASIFLDDICWTVNDYQFNFTNSTNGLFFQCLDGNALMPAVQTLLNFSDSLCNTQINQDAANFNKLYGSDAFSPVPLYVPFYSNLSTSREVAFSAMNYSLPPYVNMLSQSQQMLLDSGAFNATIFRNSTLFKSWSILVAEGFLVRGLRGAFLVMGIVSGCGTELISPFLDSLNQEICGQIRLSVGLIVWGIFAACIFFVAAAVCFWILYPFAAAPSGVRPSASHPRLPSSVIWHICCTCLACCTSISLDACILSARFALPPLIFALFILTTILPLAFLIFASLPSPWLRKPHILHSTIWMVVSAVCIILCALLIAACVTLFLGPIQNCKSSNQCSIGRCGPLEYATLFVAAVLAGLCACTMLVAALSAAAIVVVPCAREAFHSHQAFDGDIQTDFDLTSTDLSKTQ